MTPTLIGRWQTRIFLLATIGILISLPFALGIIGDHPGFIYFWILFYIGLFGLAWDCLYHFLQQFLWDHDWPGALQLIAAIVEAIFLAIVISVFGLPFVSSFDFNFGLYLFHYTVVWIAIYLLSWVVMRLLFPRWRFRGGRWLGSWQ